MQRLVAQLTTYVILSTRYYFIRYEWINLIQVSLFLSYKKELSSIYIEFSKTRSSTIRFYVLKFYSWNLYWKYRDGKIEISNELLSTNFCSSGCIRCLHLFHLQGCIPPLCELLTVPDVKIIQVALNGLENILRVGDQAAKLHSTVNPYAVIVEECDGKRLPRLICSVWISGFSCRLSKLYPIIP